MVGEHKANLLFSSGDPLRVAYRDVEGVEHRVEVDADSLYEAIAAAVNSFRKVSGVAVRLVLDAFSMFEYFQIDRRFIPLH